MRPRPSRLATRREPRRAGSAAREDQGRRAPPSTPLLSAWPTMARPPTTSRPTSPRPRDAGASADRQAQRGAEHGCTPRRRIARAAAARTPAPTTIRVAGRPSRTARAVPRAAGPLPRRSRAARAASRPARLPYPRVSARRTTSQPSPADDPSGPDRLLSVAACGDRYRSSSTSLVLGFSARLARSAAWVLALNALRLDLTPGPAAGL